MWWVLLSLVATLTAAQTCDKARIVSCALTHVDTNNDNIITTAELDAFILEGSCGVISEVTGTGIMSFCDYNNDGHLTAVDDIDPPESPCMYSAPLMQLVCNKCDYCDTMSKK